MDGSNRAMVGFLILRDASEARTSSNPSAACQAPGMKRSVG
jgi:hypothetical protein